MSVLDVGCGSGRHAVELAVRGYDVTGLDISAGMLEEARKKADDAGVRIRWIHGDAKKFAFDNSFDGLICLCEGAFGLLGSEDDPIEQPLSILRCVFRALKSSAKCLFTVLNGYALARRYQDADVQKGIFVPEDLTEISECNPSDTEPGSTLRERGFMPTELKMLFSTAGMEVEAIWGGTAGNWGKRVIEMDEIEIMVLAHKPGS